MDGNAAKWKLSRLLTVTNLLALMHRSTMVRSSPARAGGAGIVQPTASAVGLPSKLVARAGRLAASVLEVVSEKVLWRVAHGSAPASSACRSGADVLVGSA